MRIAFLIAGLHEGGAERVVTTLANRMNELGHDVRILVTWSEQCVYDLNPAIPVVPIYQSFEKFDFSKKFYLYQKAVAKRVLNLVQGKNLSEAERKLEIWKAYKVCKPKSKKLAEYLNRYKIDILYSFMEESNIIAGLSRPYTRTKIVVSERNFPLNSNLSSSMTALRDYSYGKAHHVVFQTLEQKKVFSDSIQRKGCIIFNPIKQNLPQPYVGNRKKIIVNYCRFSPQKNLSLLIRAFARIAEEYPDYCLELYGKGEQKEELEHLIRMLQLTDKIQLLPFCANIHSKIADYAMFVLSSDFEGMPNALLEAMAIGLPVVTTDCLGGGASAVIQDGINGMLIPPNDEDQLYQAIKCYINDETFAAACGKNAAAIRHILSVEQITEKWLDLVQR